MIGPEGGIQGARQGGRVLRLRRVSAAALFVAVCLSAASAAVCVPAPPGVRERERKEMYDREVVLAVGLMGQGLFAEAARILEPLCAEQPYLTAPAERLAECYVKMGETRRAEDFLKDRIARGPDHFQFNRMLGEIYLDRGDRGRAVAAWRDALGDDPALAGNYGIVGRLMREAGLYEEAVEVYREGRVHEAFRRSYTAEIIRLERLLGREKEAFSEVIRLIASAPGLNVGDVKLLADIYAESGPDDRLFALVDSAAAVAGGRRFDIARAALLLEAGRYGEAERYIEGRGALPDREFYAFIRHLSILRRTRKEDGFITFYRAALDEFLKLYPDSPVAPEVMLVLAESLREEALLVGKEELLERAVRTIDLVKRHRLGGPFRERAVLLEAEILLEDLNRPREALERLEGVRFSAARMSTRADEIRMAALIRAGDWGEAERRADSLAGSGDSARAAVGLYGKGMARFHQGRYEEAIETLSSLAESCPWSPWANDALETALLVKEALGDGTGPLDCYRGALALRARGDLRAAADSLGALVERYPSSPLSGRALFERAEIDILEGNEERAVRALRTIPELYPMSDLAPRALERLAGLARDGDTERAMELYETILERYPDDPFLERVRRAYMSLRRAAEEGE